LRAEKLSPKYYVARTNTRRCAFCGICIDACPNTARVMDEDLQSARVLEHVCQGCGICAGACPSQAAHLLNLESDQAFAMIDVMLSQSERGEKNE
jgi:heterodisulfide reductase subunit A2